jgi:hypothetical protein
LVGAAALLSLAPPAFAQGKAPPAEEREEIEDKPDKEQPAVTSGGLYTLETYPRSEVARTLTLPQGIFEFIGEFNVDLSENVAFETFNPVVGLRYGLSDTFQLEAGADMSFSSTEAPVLTKVGVGPSGVGAVDSIAFWAAGDIALAYDLIDARVAVLLPVDPEFLFDIAVGLPFKFRVSEKIAILGLEEILIIHTGDGNGDTETDKPDLLISAAGVLQVIEPLAVMVRASLFVGEFKFSDKRKLPIDLDIQYSVSNIFDVGLGVTLTNLAPPEMQGNPTDSRAARLWARFRI